MLIYPAQIPQVQAGTKLMKHSYIGHRKTIPQSSKPPPRTLLGKQLQQQVEGMNWRQQREQTNSKQLRG
jgi:hypothetical protein